MTIPNKCLALAAVVFTLCTHSTTLAAKDFNLTKAAKNAHAKMERTINDMRQEDHGTLNYSRVPWHILSDAGRWTRQDITRENWTCGFWAGCLWYDYLLQQHLGLKGTLSASEMQNLAENYTAALHPLTQLPIYDHDLGFEIYCSHGPAIEQTEKQEYKDAVVRAAERLAELYNPKVGTLLSWPRNIAMFGGHNTIMDNMINLETLFAASRLSGDRKFHDMAVRHAETTMANHFRPDYTSYHVAVYDTVSGKLKKACTHQGHADHTMWARGQSWAIYGYTMVYRETRDPKFLDWVQKVTDVYLSRLPADAVPYWDFDDPKIPDTYRDVSTACVVASALIELSDYVAPSKGDYYLTMARKMLASLSSAQYLAPARSAAILRHSVGNMPAGTEIDASIIYAEYYYLEALWRYWKRENCYTNPIINADYSDPDVCVGAGGKDFYMTASSFHCTPGLPILHSKDLVHWTIINHAVKRLLPAETYNTPQDGKGVWAPCIRYNKKTHLYYIYWGDPDQGVFVVTASDPAGDWSEPQLIIKGKGIIDPAVCWDEDGRCYMVNAYAGSRAHINSIISLRELSSDGMQAIGQPQIVFDGSSSWNHTCEGPKLYKRDGWYWILCPAGGVKLGHQLAMRSRSPWGPYEEQTVLRRGNTEINGPHQGALVSLPSGEDWFFHFQDKEAYGRVVWLEPVTWKDGYPVMGREGEPVVSYRMPNVGQRYLPTTPQTSDEFDNGFGLQWQWNANYQENYGQPTAQGTMRLFCHRNSEQYANLSEVGNLFLQKTPAEQFSATARLSLTAREEGQQGGIVCFGRDYTMLVLKRVGNSFQLQQITYKGDKEETQVLAELPAERIDTEGFLPRATHCTAYLRLQVEYLGGMQPVAYPIPDGQQLTPSHKARLTFAYSADGKTFTAVGSPFIIQPSLWTGAKIGLVAQEPSSCRNSGWIDVDWFRINK